MAKLSPIATGILGAAKSATSFLRGQIQSQMIRQQREQQLAQMGMQQQELQQQQQRLDHMRQQQRDLMMTEAAKLSETIRANKANEQLYRERTEAGITEAGIRAGATTNKPLTMAQALRAVQAEADDAWTNFYSRPDIFAYDEFGKETGFTPAGQQEFDRLTQQYNRESMWQRANEMLGGMAPAPTQPVQAAPDYSALSDPAREAAGRIDPLGLSPAEVLRQLEAEGALEASGLTPEDFDALKEHYRERQRQGG